MRTSHFTLHWSRRLNLRTVERGRDGASGDGAILEVALIRSTYKYLEGNLRGDLRGDLLGIRRRNLALYSDDEPFSSCPRAEPKQCKLTIAGNKQAVYMTLSSFCS